MFIDLKLKNLEDEYKNTIKDCLKVITVLVVINIFMRRVGIYNSYSSITPPLQSGISG